MTTREKVLTVLLGVVGLVAAAGITLAANAISGEKVGLSAQPVSLADASQATKPMPAPGPKDEAGDDHGGEAETELGDDRGGSNSGPGSPNSGEGGGEARDRTETSDDSRHSGSGTSGSSGSGKSGSGTSGSGSSGSGTSGSGSDDLTPDDSSGPG
jgi:hypothetical protein